MSYLRQFWAMPAQYKAETAWGPLQALAATMVVVFAPLVIVSAVMIVQSANGVVVGTEGGFIEDMMRLNTPIGVMVLGFSQLMSLVLVWWFAGRQGMRWQTLSLTSATPSYAQCALIGVVLIVVMGIVELALYYLIRFDIFKDSKFLVDGLRSSMWPAALFLAVVLAPLWEELTFRGFLLSALAKSRLGVLGGGLLSNLLWTGLHASYSIPALISVFSAGLVITWLVWKTGSLRVAIVTHALVNATAAAFSGTFAP